MNWNEFGDNEWQIIKNALIEQKLPPVRNEDLFLFGDRPEGKHYKITKWGDLVTVDQIYQKFDVFDPTWIKMGIDKGFSYISHGLFQYY